MIRTASPALMSLRRAAVCVTTLVVASRDSVSVGSTASTDGDAAGAMG
jgi:hypothetical protein